MPNRWPGTAHSCAVERSRRIPKNRPRSNFGHGRSPCLTAGALVLLVALAVGIPTAAGQDVPVPSAPAGETQGAAPAPPVAAPAPAPAATAPVTAAPRMVALRLRVGSRGDAVRDLQRELRRRGQRIAVDGAFGPATKKAVKRMQKRFRMKQTGVADAKLLKRLGLPTRAAAAARAAPAATPVPAATGYLKIFPVAGEYSYFDDYGAPRGQGVHEGIDIMADRGTPLVAVDDGTISKMTRTESGLGGICMWLRRADGVQYYYAHMESIAEGLEVGSRISVGQVVGGVGNTGDARSAAPHLHFEIRNAWTPINPYPHLQAVDPTARAGS
jgi:murein DD-endopeptidase MepM/ murein hydrolase activator NlpD